MDAVVEYSRQSEQPEATAAVRVLLRFGQGAGELILVADVLADDGARMHIRFWVDREARQLVRPETRFDIWDGGVVGSGVVLEIS